ncbi:MAG: Gfo/Idh/MocA family protein [Planctomycetota bacterium]|jgi:hypothetical protein
MSDHQETSIAGQEPKPITRRGFIAGAGAAALSFTVAKPEHVRGAGANSKVNLGLIGCGGRGTWIAELFKQHGGYNVVAVADYFQDRIDNAGDKLGVPAANRFPGLSGYKKLLEKVDAVAIESPPYFHPEQAALAVESRLPWMCRAARVSAKAAGRLRERSDVSSWIFRRGPIRSFSRR